MHPARRSDVRVLLADALLAVALGALILTVTRLAALNQIPFRHPLDALGYGLLATAAAALVLRRVAPLVALAITAATITTYLVLIYPYGPVFLTLAVAAYSTATRLHPRRSALACGIALVVVVGGHLAEQTALAGWGTVFNELIPMLLFGTGVLVAPWAIGTAVRLHRESGARAREDETRRRAYEERLRVVQEVHDVVGHGLSAINLQSGVALHVLDQRPEHARPALEAIRQTSKDALDELRATLAVFRTDETSDRSPTSGLDQLPALAERMRQAGLPVSIDVAGQPRERPATVDLAAYRIVQESLTNVLRHAAATTAEVQVQHHPDAVEVTVTDDGRGGESPITESQGDGSQTTEPQGIVGMRQRATAVGGTLHAGPRPEGGFRVRARLPLADPSSPDPSSADPSSAEESS